MDKYLLGSLFALFGWAGLAQAQIALGAPAPPENNLEKSYGPYAPALYSAACHADCMPKPSHPIRAAVGHLMPPRCDEMQTKEKEEVARMMGDAGYSPAEIKIGEAKGDARRVAVKYLATIDCHYYPEAESGLIAALRMDRAEIVRFEAAVALSNCRRLTEKMLEALNLTALGLELDGNPAESSERVRGAARGALHRCSCRGLCLPPLEQPLVAVIDWLPPDSFPVQPVGYYVRTHVPVAAPVTQHERDIAETVSADPKSAAGLFSLRRLFLRFTSSGESTRDTRKNVDPRLRGLAPLGSETLLAIPTTHPYPFTITPMQPYNYQE